MGVLSWILGGFVIGVLAKWLVRDNPNLGCIGTVALGIAGSLVGGTIANLITGDGLDVAGSGFLGSLAGAIGLLLFMRSRANEPTT